MIQKKTKRARPTINTSALPDIIFMLLFFFMVVTVLRQQKKMLHIKLPKATEVTKLQNRSLIQYIYIGKPVQQEEGDATRIQINDAFISVGQLEYAVRTLNRDKAGIINSLKVDENVRMGIVTEVKTALRKTEQLKLNYEVIAEAGAED